MLLIQFLNALQFSMTLFLLAVGLTIIFGLMKIVNLAHGSLYMIGAYVGLSIWSYFDSFWLALIFSPIITSLVGAFLYLILFRHIQNADPMRQVLLTFGLIYIGLDSVRLIWGTMSHSISAPDLLSNSIMLINEPYPSYRLFVIFIGVFVLLCLYFILEKTIVGAKVRASVDDPETAKLLNIGFPGGPQIEKLAKKGVPLIPLAQPLIHSNDCNFSFSGLKTSVLHVVNSTKKKSLKFK